MNANGMADILYIIVSIAGLPMYAAIMRMVVGRYVAPTSVHNAISAHSAGLLFLLYFSSLRASTNANVNDDTVIAKQMMIFKKSSTIMR